MSASDEAGLRGAVIDFAEEHGGRCRLEFAEPRRMLHAERLGDVEAVLRAAQAHADAGAWVVGLVCYEAAPAFDPALRVREGGTLPLACFGVFDAPLARADQPVAADASAAAPAMRPEIERRHYESEVEAIRQGIARGEFYQVNHTLRAHAGFDGDARAWFQRLRLAQPDGYCAYLDLGRHRIASVSPELFFRREGGRITTRPMKGTRPRGRHPAEDAALERELRESPKDRAENLMIVDLLRNDLSRLARPHGVRVERRFAVERHPTVWQMTSTVVADLRAGVGLYEVFRALFPCGSVTGAPKVRAMQRIAAGELSARDAYCGAIGMLRPGGDAVFNVAIRTVTVDTREARASCGLGGGIVWDSTPAAEYDEVLVKARFLQRESRPFQLIETLRVEHGRALREGLHLARLEASARHLGFAVDAAGWREMLRAAARGAAGGVARLRMLLHADGTLRTQVSQAPAGLDGRPACFALAAEPVSRDDWRLFHKTTLREPYECALAGRDDVFDVLLWNREGELTEFTRGNLALELDGRLLTPALDGGLLDGCLRREWIAQGRLREARLDVDDLRRARRAWFLNSLRGALELHWLEAPACSRGGVYHRAPSPPV